jgi:hypothetical protein
VPTIVVFEVVIDVRERYTRVATAVMGLLAFRCIGKMTYPSSNKQKDNNSPRNMYFAADGFYISK